VAIPEDSTLTVKVLPVKVWMKICIPPQSTLLGECSTILKLLSSEDLEAAMGLV